MISVIISCFNAEHYVADALNSILKQTAHPFEIIVIDDASDDGTPEIIKYFADKYDFVRPFFNQKNMGLPENLNKAIKHAKGAFIARMDADDLMHPDKLQKQKDFLLLYPEVSMCGTNAFLIDEQAHITGVKRVDQTTDFNKLLKKIDVIHPTVMFRKDFFEKFGYYDPAFRHAQDMELWLKATRKGAVIKNLQEELYYLRFDRKTIQRRKNGQRYRIQIKKKYLKGWHLYRSLIPNYLVLYLPDFFLNLILRMKTRAKQ